MTLSYFYSLLVKANKIIVNFFFLFAVSTVNKPWQGAKFFKAYLRIFLKNSFLFYLSSRIVVSNWTNSFIWACYDIPTWTTFFNRFKFHTPAWSSSKLDQSLGPYAPFLTCISYFVGLC